MPGVPTSRGCDACRKQKKKCDPSVVPCSRCSRLGIACTGSGQQRYVFRNRTSPPKDDSSDKVKPAKISLNSSSLVPRNVTNDHMRLVGSMIDKLSPSNDFRYHLSWNFGGFLQQIPRRLGRNEALDAATDCLLTTYSNYCGGNIRPSHDVLVKHSLALQTLRRSLDDSSTAQTSETLCAVLLLVLQRSMIGCEVSGEVPEVTHSQGAAQLVKARGPVKPRDEFEDLLLRTVRGPVVVEAVLHSNIIFTRKQWQHLVEMDADQDSLDSKPVRYLGLIPDFRERGKALQQDMSGFSSLLQDLRSAFDSFELHVAQMQARLTADLTDLAEESTSDVKPMLYAHYTRMYALALMTSIILGSLLASLEQTSEGDMRIKLASMADEVLKLAPLMAVYRPLGGMFMVVCLAAAWVGATDDFTKSCLKFWLDDYSKDFSPDVEYIPQSYLEGLVDRFTIRVPLQESTPDFSGIMGSLVLV